MTAGPSPRVLIDATSVPADRGGVGRYVDGLLGALGRRETDLAVVCLRTDTERYERLLPNADVVTAPWRNTGLAPAESPWHVVTTVAGSYDTAMPTGTPLPDMS